MKNEFNGFDLTFVNICNEAVSKQRSETKEWEEVKKAGVKAVREARIKRFNRLKKYKREKKICRKEKALTTITCAIFILMGCINF